MSDRFYSYLKQNTLRKVKFAPSCKSNISGYLVLILNCIWLLCPTGLDHYQRASLSKGFTTFCGFNQNFWSSKNKTLILFYRMLGPILALGIYRYFCQIVNHKVKVLFTSSDWWTLTSRSWWGGIIFWVSSCRASHTYLQRGGIKSTTPVLMFMQDCENTTQFSKNTVATAWEWSRWQVRGQGRLLSVPVGLHGPASVQTPIPSAAFLGCPFLWLSLSLPCCSATSFCN